jgi:DNA processing protein
MRYHRKQMGVIDQPEEARSRPKPSRLSVPFPGTTPSPVGPASRTRRSSYIPPPHTQVTSLRQLLEGLRTIDRVSAQQSLSIAPRDRPLYLAGDVALVQHPAVAIVGARKASPEGVRRAARLARELAAANVVIVSGLAEGIDTAAHRAAIESGGRTIAVIGTPLDAAFPASNAELQQEIYRNHLLVSQFEVGSRVRPANFPERNKVMAAIADATVIIEASDTSGSLHQAVECTNLGRPLFIAKSVADNPSLQWPKRFLAHPDITHVLEKTDDILGVLPWRR